MVQAHYSNTSGLGIVSWEIDIDSACLQDPTCPHPNFVHVRGRLSNLRRGKIKPLFFPRP
jgi:hypothetical protein